MSAFRDERGAVPIVEASIVFPVTLFVLCFLLVVGNAYFQRSRVEKVVMEETVSGAARYAEPYLALAESEGGLPASVSDGGKDTYGKLYRYINMGSRTLPDVETAIKNRVSGRGSGFFSAMSLQDVNVSTKVNSILVYSTLETNVTYRITIPVRLLGMDNFMSIPYSSHVEIAVTDAPEFIRNIGMAKYYYVISGLEGRISEIMAKAEDLYTVAGRSGS
jgi:hypothetical protein